MCMIGLPARRKITLSRGVQASSPRKTIKKSPVKHNRGVQANTPKKSILHRQLRQSHIQIANLRDKLVLLQAENEKQNVLVKRLISANNLQKKPELLKYFTGLCNYNIFLTLLKYVSPLLSKTPKCVDKADCLLIVLIKLRLNVGNMLLAYQFGVCCATVSRIMHSVIPVLAQITKQFIVIPTKEQAAKHLPDAFKLGDFRRTRFIIDCTEIFIERPTSLTARAQTYSNYKNHNTLKFLIACTANGGVCFVSRAWPGRISDIELVRRSNFYDCIENGDHILAVLQHRTT